MRPARSDRDFWTPQLGELYVVKMRHFESYGPGEMVRTDNFFEARWAYNRYRDLIEKNLTTRDSACIYVRAGVSGGPRWKGTLTFYHYVPLRLYRRGEGERTFPHPNSEPDGD